MTTYESIRAFISSASDVEEERNIARRVISSISDTCRDTLGIELKCVSWKDFAPVATKLPDERIQDTLNAEIPKCQMFILIVGERYGSIEPGETKSNTQRETEIALDLLKKEKKIMFLAYFRDLPVCKGCRSTTAKR